MGAALGVTTMKIFYIGGCFRSGTTLMRLCLDSHPAITVYDEGFSRRFLKSRELEVERDAPKDALAIGFKVPRLTEQIATLDAAILPPLAEKSVVVGMVRNPLQVVASMKRLNPKLAPLLDGGFGFPDMAVIEAMFPDQAKLLAERKAKSNPEIHEAIRSGLLWRFKTSALVNSTLDKLLVNYDDLVTKPAEVLTTVLAKLEVPWDAQVLRHQTVEHDECNIGGNGLGYGMINPKRAIDLNSLALYKKLLSADEQKAVLSVTEDLFESLF
jgi:hypothetical protein